jgi:hypothetical protein
MSEALALSLSEKYVHDRALLGRPISTLARMAGLTVDDVYRRLIPELARTDLGEVIKFAKVGLHYASIVDRNRLREECGPQFIIALDMIINSVKQGLDSKEAWIRRAAMTMHGDLIDEMAEKQRFIETLMTDRKIEILKESKEKIAKLQAEIYDLEEKDGAFEICQT